MRKIALGFSAVLVLAVLAFACIALRRFNVTLRSARSQISRENSLAFTLEPVVPTSGPVFEPVVTVDTPTTAAVFAGLLLFDGTQLRSFSPAFVHIDVTALAGNEADVWIGTRDRGLQLATSLDRRSGLNPSTVSEDKEPPFFSRNMMSLSDTFEDLDSETYTEFQASPTLTRQTVRYPMRKR